MSRKRSGWLRPMMLSLTSLLVMGGCGGGGSSSPPPVAKASISGAVTFPSTTLSLNQLVAKRAGATVPSTDVTVAAYDLDGKQIGAAVVPEFDNAVSEDKRIYSYKFTGLDLGKDYVIKAKRLNVVLKKIIERKTVVGNLPGQNLSAVSTAAVIVASKKLGAVLGDPLPTGTTSADLSTKIGTDIKPVLLEETINAVVTGGKSAVTDPNQAAFANVYNIVVTAASESRDPATMFTANPPTLTNTVPILTVATGTTTATVTQTAVDATVVSSSAAPTYTPPDPTELAAKYNLLAKTALTAQDISGASLNYEKALSLDPNDAEANFGGAITSGMMLIEDADVQAIITKWGAVVPTVNQIVQGTSPIKLPFGNLTSVSFPVSGKVIQKGTAKVAIPTATQNAILAFNAMKARLPQQKAGFKSLAKELKLVPATAPSIGEMQTLINNTIIPRIDKINARLAKAEAKAGFSFTVTMAMQGNPVNGKDITLDAGECYTLDAALNLFQILFKIAGSYNFDIPAPFTYDTLGLDPLAMINSSTVFTLKSGGLAQMNGALENARTAVTKAKLAYDTLAARAAGVGAFDLTGMTAQEKTDFTSGLAKAELALVGQYDFLTGGRLVKVDATKFFTNPLTRASLPTFGYDVARDAALSTKYGRAVAGEINVQRYVGWDPATNQNIYQTVLEPVDCDIVVKSDLPDYTLNGILPGNSAATNVAEFNGILPHLDGKLTSSNVHAWNFTTDGADIYYLEQGVYTPTAGYSYNIKKIAVATGYVTTANTVTSQTWAESLFYYNGSFYLTQYNGALYKITGTTVATTPEFSLPNTVNGNVTAGVASGADIYYVVGTWNPMTYEETSTIYKYSNGTDSVLFSVPEYVGSIGISNGSIYLDADETEKRSMTGTLSARYVTGGDSWDILVGGYFYSVNNGKLNKFAGTPQKGAAKLAKYFGL